MRRTTASITVRPAARDLRRDDAWPGCYRTTSPERQTRPAQGGATNRRGSDPLKDAFVSNRSRGPSTHVVVSRNRLMRFRWALSMGASRGVALARRRCARTGS